MRSRWWMSFGDERTGANRPCFMASWFRLIAHGLSRSAVSSDKGQGIDAARTTSGSRRFIRPPPDRGTFATWRHARVRGLMVIPRYSRCPGQAKAAEVLQMQPVVVDIGHRAILPPSGRILERHPRSADHGGRKRRRDARGAAQAHVSVENISELCRRAMTFRRLCRLRGT